MMPCKKSAQYISFFSVATLLLSITLNLAPATANQIPSLPQLPGGLGNLPSGLTQMLGGNTQLPSGVLPLLGSSTSGGSSSTPGAGATSGGASGGGTSMGNAITLTEEQIKALPEEQQKQIREALEKAKAAAGATPSGSQTGSVDLGAIASQAQGLLASLTKNLKPEQQKMLADAQKSGKLPEGFAEMLLSGATDPAILAKLTQEQRDALQKAIVSGELSAEVIKELIGEVDAGTIKEVAKSIAEQKTVDLNKVKEVVTKVAKLVCTNGKKKITVKTKRCPSGFKKN